MKSVDEEGKLSQQRGLSPMRGTSSACQMKVFLFSDALAYATECASYYSLRRIINVYLDS